MKTVKEALKNSVAYLMTQYCNYGKAGKNEYIKYYIDEELQLDINNLSEYNEYLESNGYEEYFSFNDIDSYLDGMEPFEIFRLATFSNVSFLDDYLKFNGYGNLDSFSEYQIVEEMNHDEDFKIWYYENYIDPADQTEIDEAITDCNVLLAAGY